MSTRNLFGSGTSGGGGVTLVSSNGSVNISKNGTVYDVTAVPTAAGVDPATLKALAFKDQAVYDTDVINKPDLTQWAKWTQLGNLATKSAVDWNLEVNNKPNLDVYALQGGAINVATQATGLLPIANGGTNASTSTAARTNLGLKALATKDQADWTTDVSNIDLYATLQPKLVAGTDIGLAMNGTTKTITINNTRDLSTYLKIVDFYLNLKPQLVAGTGVTLTTDDVAKTITINGTATDLSAYLKIVDLYLNLKPKLIAGTGVTLTTDDTAKTITVNATATDLSAYLKIVDLYLNLKPQLVAGTGVTLTTNDTAKTITINASATTGDIYANLKTNLRQGTGIGMVVDDTNKLITVNNASGVSTTVRTLTNSTTTSSLQRTQHPTQPLMSDVSYVVTTYPAPATAPAGSTLAYQTGRSSGSTNAWKAFDKDVLSYWESAAYFSGTGVYTGGNSITYNDTGTTTATIAGEWLELRTAYCLNGTITTADVMNFNTVTLTARDLNTAPKRVVIFGYLANGNHYLLTDTTTAFTASILTQTLTVGTNAVSGTSTYFSYALLFPTTNNTSGTSNSVRVANLTWNVDTTVTTTTNANQDNIVPYLNNAVLDNPVISGGVLQIGYSVLTSVAGGSNSLLVGSKRTADGLSWVDLIATSTGSDFLRVIRYGGINGDAYILNSGTGTLYVQSSGGNVVLNTQALGSVYAGGTSGSINLGTPSYRWGTVYANNYDGVNEIRNGTNKINNGASGWMITTSNWYPSSDGVTSLGMSGNRYANIWGVNVYSANGTIQTSDEERKEAIAPLNQGLDLIEKLQPITYRFIDGDGKTRMGFGARATQQILEQANMQNYSMVHADDASGWGMIYSELMAPLVKAVQQLSQQNRDLQHRVAVLEQKTARLPIL